MHAGGGGAPPDDAGLDPRVGVLRRNLKASEATCRALRAEVARLKQTCRGLEARRVARASRPAAPPPPPLGWPPPSRRRHPAAAAPPPRRRLRSLCRSMPVCA